MKMKYFNLFTQVGLEKIAAAILSGEKVKVTQMAVGDGGGGYYEPTADMTGLRREVWRGDTTFEVDPADTTHLKAVMLLPGSVGGFVIRKYAIFDEAGDMLAISNTADIVKAVAAEGMSTEVRLVMNLFLTGDQAQVIRYDPTVIIATKEDVAAVDSKRLLHETDGVKHVSDAEKASWNAKVDRVAGKGLSANNYTDGDKEQVGKIAGLSNPNLLINGDFRNIINQRGQTEYRTIAGKLYTADRWLAFSTGYSLNGEVNISSEELQLKRNAENQPLFLCQTIENRMVGGAVTFSVKACSTIENVNMALAIYGGANGYPNVGETVDLYVDKSFTVTSTKAYFTFTINVPENIHYIAVQIGNVSGGSLHIQTAKLELGTVATPFVPRPYGEEMALCQRYYQNSWSGYTLATVNQNGGISGKSLNINIWGFTFITQMRVAPAIKVYSAVNKMQGKVSLTDFNNQSYEIDTGRILHKNQLYAQFFTEITSFSRGDMLFFHYEADAEIY